ncbi:MAG: ATPase, partial [Candidatus Marinimicrobia bacterium]|nr:ATPase [Candidatus Neomarinimicrobiota bacterium]
MEFNLALLNEQIQSESVFLDKIKKELHKVLIGQEKMLERLLIGLLSEGHILLEGVPGL